MSQFPRVLVIDDNELFARTVQHMLRRQDLEVETAFDGPSGLVRASTGEFALVVLDLIMPKLDGFDIIKALQDHPQRPQLIAMSGNVSVQGPVSLQSALDLGADAILEKPFPQEKLFEAVSRLLAKVERFPRPKAPSGVRARLFA